MPTASINGVELYYEVSGRGDPLIFCHEFAGDYRSWEQQVRYFSRLYTVVTWNYRGYTPSGVPEDQAAYSEEQLVEDLYGLIRHLGYDKPHIAGLSMGGAVALKIGLAHPEVCRSLCIAGAGSGAVNKEQFIAEAQAQSQRFLDDPVAAFDKYAKGPARLQFLEKDPRGWHEFIEHLKQHSPQGAARTMRGVQMKRKSIFDIEDQLPNVKAPSLIMVGDEDNPCLDTALLMKRKMPNAGLAILPKSGHAINIEEPALFNQLLLDFLVRVERGAWFPTGEMTTSLMPSELRDKARAG
jgi:pimeloyl-ACP methyl ester carboxylesterase